MVRFFLSHSNRLKIFYAEVIFAFIFFSPVEKVLAQVAVDSSFINKYPSTWSAQIYFQNTNNQFGLKDHLFHESISSDPINRQSLGAEISYRNLAVSLGFGLNHSSNEPTSNVNLLGSYYNNMNAVDFGFQLHRGYNISVGNNSVFRSDIRTFNFGFQYNYVFNFKQFSYNAAFSSGEIQRKNAGSVIAGLFLTYYDLAANTSIADSDLVISEQAKISEANLLSAGLVAGYAYTLVLPFKLYATISLTPGISFNLGDYKSDVYYSFGNPFTLSAKLVSHDAFGYDNGRIFSSVNVLIDDNFVNLQQHLTFHYDLSKWNLVFGYRFN